MKISKKKLKELIIDFIDYNMAVPEKLDEPEEEDGEIKNYYIPVEHGKDIFFSTKEYKEIKKVNQMMHSVKSLEEICKIWLSYMNKTSYWVMTEVDFLSYLYDNSMTLDANNEGDPMDSALNYLLMKLVKNKKISKKYKNVSSIENDIDAKIFVKYLSKLLKK